MEDPKVLTETELLRKEIEAIQETIKVIGRHSECPFFADPTESVSEKVRHMADECTFLASEIGADIPEDELREIMARLKEDHMPFILRDAMEHGQLGKSPYGVN